jgi:glycine dehydrogenase
LATLQALLANMAGMYGVYHGPEGLTRIAQRCRNLAAAVASGARALGHSTPNSDSALFDTICIDVGDSAKMAESAERAGVNVRVLDASRITVSIDETTTPEDANLLLKILGGGTSKVTVEELAEKVRAPQTLHAIKKKHALLLTLAPGDCDWQLRT